jgi:hypothetical protein
MQDGFMAPVLSVVVLGRNHISFPAKTMKHHPISWADGQGCNPKVFVTPPFAG